MKLILYTAVLMMLGLMPLDVYADVDYAKIADGILSLPVSSEEKIDSAFRYLNYNIDSYDGYVSWENVIEYHLIPYMKNKKASDLTMAKLYYQLGITQQVQGDERYGDRDRSFNIAESFARKSGNRYWRARIIDNKAVCEINSGNQAKGLELMEEAIKIYRGSGDDSDKRIGGCLYSEAIVFFNSGDRDGIASVINKMKKHAATASPNYKPIIKYNQYAVQTVYFGMCIRESGSEREKRNYLDSMDMVGQSAIHLIETTPEIWQNPQALPVWDYYNRAVRFVEYEERPVVDSVEYYLDKMTQVDFRGIENRQSEVEISATSLRAEMWMKLGDYLKAKQSIIATIEKADSLKRVNNIIIDKIELYRNLLEIAKQSGNYKEAVEYAEMVNELERERYSDERTKAIKEIEIKYKTQETELALAQSEAHRNSTLMWLFAAVALLIAIVAIFIMYANRQRRVRLQNYIDGLESERSRMSRELHDGVCNDLLAIQMTMTNPENIALIETCRESVRRISHELMPPEFEYATLDEVVRYFIGKQQQRGVTVSYTSEIDGSDWGKVPQRIALETYRIIQEAVGNAIKHSGGDSIDVTMVLKENDLTVTVTDNGQCETSGKRGLGMKTLYRRANAIGAEMEILKSMASGTKVCLHVKI